MKTTLLSFITFLLVMVIGCSKSSTNDLTQIIPIPNGDFDLWAGGPGMLSDWQTNSCPPCLPPYESNIIRPDSPAYHGMYAAKFIYNNVFAAMAENKFAISAHPTDLTGYVKCSLAPTDSVSITVKIYQGNAVVDSGQWYGTSSIGNYTQITIPITQANPNADSAYIKIVGGHKGSYPSSDTQFWVDDFYFQKF